MRWSKTRSARRPSTRRARPRGLGAIAKFYDEVVAPSERITFEIERSYLCGDEVADVGIIRTCWRVAGMSPWCAGVHLPRLTAMELAALRAFWEFDATELVAAEDV